MFCRNCGNEITDTSAFCPKCGTPVTAEAPQYNQQNQYNQQGQYNQAPKSNAGGFFSDFSIASQPSAPGPNNGNVDFLTAIKLFFKNYTNFKGRASKSEYWWTVLFTFILGCIPVVGQIGALFCLIPNIAIIIRRLHDTGKSGAYYFISLIPFAGVFILLFRLIKDSDGDNQYGPANMAQFAQAAAPYAPPAPQYNPVNTQYQPVNTQYQPDAQNNQVDGNQNF